MKQSYFRVSVFPVLVMVLFSTAAFAEKSYLPAALDSVERIKKQQKEIESYQGQGYVPSVSGVGLPRAEKAYELPAHLKPYEFKTSQGLVQVYKPIKVYEAPKAPDLIPNVPMPEVQQGSASVAAEPVSGSLISSSSKTVVSESSQSSPTPAAKPAEPKKKVGFLGF